MTPKDGLSSPTPNTATKETKHGLIIVDAIDADLLDYAAVHKGYARCTIGTHNKQPVRVPMHRIIVGRIRGLDLTPDMQVDHINHNPLDNRRENLRACSVAQNQFNAKRSVANTTGYKGVSYHKATGRYQARIRDGQKQRWVGLFDTAEQAYAAYVAKARELHGEYANDGRGCLILSDGGVS